MVRQVELGRPYVIWVQQFRPRGLNMRDFARHPILDKVHLFAANSCGVLTSESILKLLCWQVLFYITMLPLLFWARVS